ncbi:MAG: HAMP domain-containing protein [Ignavibacteria bacterium]|nr:HAMP domain-containing protein [Ignavibacteria bacterium]
MKFTRLLAFRLFVTIILVMLVGTIVVTVINTQWQSQRYMESMVGSAFRASDIIKRSTHYSMLLNRREDIYQIITTVGTEPGIHGIRVYDKRGTVTFSTDSAEVGTRVDMSAEACNACHGVGTPPLSPNPDELTRVFKSPKGYRVLGMITPIYNESSCSSAACHAHPATQTVLGVLDVMLPLDEIDALLVESTHMHYLSSFILVAAVALVSGIFIWFLVNIPVRNLTLGTQEIIKGNLSYRIRVRSKDEVGALARSFNQMSQELQRAQEEILEWTQTLEHRVAQKTEELQRAQHHMIHVEKMASLGKLAATVAHELNNPLEGILTYAKLLKKKIHGFPLPEEKSTEIQTELSLIADESSRCGSIVKNLLLFARRDRGQMTKVSLQSIVERSLRLIDHHLKMNRVALERELSDQPIMLYCDPEQIEQALLALEINAVEAMAEGGTLKIQAALSDDARNALLRIADNGVGIAKENLEHIFEPFFSTKESGKATGLGLAVVFGIVERHRGTIAVESNIGVGTTFTMTLPIQTETDSHAAQSL